MIYNLELHKRHSIRIPEYDYSTPNSYFITICTNKRQCILSKICDNSNNYLLDFGKIIDRHIKKCKEKYEDISIDNYVIMPNHIHLIITIKQGQPWATAPTIATIISTLKTMVTKEIGYSIWQRNYYEHIIRNEKEYLEIFEYIENNPINWKKDINYIK